MISQKWIPISLDTITYLINLGDKEAYEVYKEYKYYVKTKSANPCMNSFFTSGGKIIFFPNRIFNIDIEAADGVEK